MTVWQSLFQAIAWCSTRSGCEYRASATLPAELLVRVEGRRILVADPREASDCVADAVSRRAAALAARAPAETFELSGRLLAFRFRQTLSDGAAEDVSDGWFDANNQPPWDAWIGLIDDDTLLSWVSPSLVPCVERAIFVNAERCISWFDGTLHPPSA